MTASKFSVSAGELRAALMTAAKTAGRKPPPSLWIFNDGTLSLDWAGICHELSIQGRGSIKIRVAGSFALALAKTLAKTGDLELSVDGDSFTIGRWTVTCTVIDHDPGPMMLPVGASGLDVLLLRHCRTVADIEAAGYTQQVNAEMEHIVASCAKAASHLAWLNITPTMLEGWIHAHVEAVARGNRSFSIQPYHPVDAQGQGLLFSSKPDGDC